MAATPQERLALGVVALLLAAGAGARILRQDPVPPALAGAPAAEASAALTGAVADSVARAERRSAPLAPGERIDPNTATADELDRLPKVGPALASRIVEWRDSRGAFRTLADLDSVPGVGPALLRDAAPHLALAPAPAAPPPARAAPARASSFSPASGAVVHINQADEEELATLPGVGPALARRIVEWRRANGPFPSVDALAEVRGIGPATVERLRPRIRT